MSSLQGVRQESIHTRIGMAVERSTKAQERPSFSCDICVHVKIRKVVCANLDLDEGPGHFGCFDGQQSRVSDMIWAFLDRLSLWVTVVGSGVADPGLPNSLTCRGPLRMHRVRNVVVNAVGRYLLFNLSTVPTPIRR